jgi:5S rRNA maturation endonuclease (ribonuclease M5)
MFLLGFHRWCLIFQLYVPLVAGRISASERFNGRNTKNFVRSVHRRFNNTVHQQLRLEEIELELEYYPVIIGVNNDNDGTIIQSMISRLAKVVRRKFKRINAFSAVVTRSELNELKENPNILYIEEDTMVYPNSDEATLYGLQMVQAFAPIISKQNLTSTAACNDPKSFKIGIVDSGLAM